MEHNLRSVTLAADPSSGQRVDVELFERDLCDIFVNERAIVVLHEAKSVGPVPPVRRRQCETVQSQIKSVMDAPHRDMGIRTFELDEAGHKNARLDHDLRRAKNYEQ